jgi:PAS domain S-box-containing protein
VNGRIYDKNEQDALQILCNQFAVALENAQMYTEMQDSKIQNEIMLDQLVSGVIVANPERKITLINHEAERITGLTKRQTLGQGMDFLPETVTEALDATLATRDGIQNTDAILFVQEEEKSVHVRMGSAYLMGYDDKPMGALLVFTDMTEVKSLEEQVRRADQLSSVGTLAAGMAHEIKNPLVTIKTFTQLLPERHADEDFRKDFSSLVADEVLRIDGIVNQLLSFSKPSHPHLVPMKLHQTVEQTLKLIQEQMSQKDIVLKNNLHAKQDLISGDADLLTQALVNLNLNAVDAIGSEGTITVTTSNCTYAFALGTNPENSVKKPCVRLQINDTGAGIEKSQLQKIFDPFFTSKSEGTGMGLSVAHGIIQEHHGVIDVESTPGKGTSFYVYIPILKEGTAA